MVAMAEVAKAAAMVEVVKAAGMTAVEMVVVVMAAAMAAAAMVAVTAAEAMAARVLDKPSISARARMHSARAAVLPNSDPLSSKRGDRFAIALHDVRSILATGFG